MNRKLDRFLVKRFQSIFAQRYQDMTTTAMCWGFMCGDGWARLIYDLCLKIELLEKTFGIVIEASQVKEKYGLLCFYVYSDYTKVSNAKLGKMLCSMVSDLICSAEDRSGQLCEVCGDYGQVYPGSWIVTRCEDCALEEGRVLVDESELP